MLPPDETPANANPKDSQQEPAEKHDTELGQDDFGLELGKTLAGVILSLFLVVPFMFMYSGAMAHGAKPAHPTAGHIGSTVAGLSPMGAWLAYRLARYGKRSLGWILLAVAVGVAVFIGMQYLGIKLLRYALPNQPIHFG